MKNLLTVAVIAISMAVAFSACVTVGEGSGGGAGGGGGGGAAAAGAVAEDGSMMLIAGTTGAGWSPEFGGLAMRNGVLTFTTVRQGDRFRTDGRYRFPRRMDVSAYTGGYLKLDIMISDAGMMDAMEATMQLSSADFNYMKWKFNEIGSFEDGLSPQVPVEANVWTTITFPLYANSWEDAFTDNGINLSRVERFDFYFIGIPVDGTVSLRNIRVVSTP